MLDIGWYELAIVAVVALVIIGPKDLPKAMKSLAYWLRKARALTREFQSGFEDMVREAELDDAKKMLDDTRRGNLQQTISNAIDPTGDVTAEVREIEREARSDGPSGGAGANAADDNAADKVASVMTKPAANIAPPHSITPPSETTATSPANNAVPEDAAAGKEDSKQSA